MNRSSLERFSLNANEMPEPIAESTCISSGTDSSSRPMWLKSRLDCDKRSNSSQCLATGLMSPARNSANFNSTTIHRQRPQPIRMEHRLQGGIPKSGFASRKCFDDEKDIYLSRSNSAGNLNIPYKAGQFPNVNLNKTVSPYRAQQPKISMTRIAPPQKTNFSGITLSSLLRSNSIVGISDLKSRDPGRDDRPIIHPLPNETDIEPTRSVIDALKEISRKRIINDDMTQDQIAKKNCTRDTFDYADNVPSSSHVSNKRTRSMEVNDVGPSSPEHHAKRKYFKCSNDITSSLSSSIPHSNKRKFDHRNEESNLRTTPNITEDEHVNKIHRKESQPHLDTFPKSINQALDAKTLPNFEKMRRLQYASNHILSEQTNIEVPFTTSSKQKLTLFNKKYKNNSTYLEDEMSNLEVDTQHASFVKPRKQETVFKSKNTITRTQKSKLALMLKGLRGEVYLGEEPDEFDEIVNDLIDGNKRNLSSIPTNDTLSGSLESRNNKPVILSDIKLPPAFTESAPSSTVNNDLGTSAPLATTMSANTTTVSLLTTPISSTLELAQSDKEKSLIPVFNFKKDTLTGASTLSSKNDKPVESMSPIGSLRTEMNASATKNAAPLKNVSFSPTSTSDHTKQLNGGISLTYISSTDNKSTIITTNSTITNQQKISATDSSNVNQYTREKLFEFGQKALNSSNVLSIGTTNTTMSPQFVPNPQVAENTLKVGGAHSSSVLSPLLKNISQPNLTKPFSFGEEQSSHTSPNTTKAVTDTTQPATANTLENTLIGNVAPNNNAAKGMYATSNTLQFEKKSSVFPSSESVKEIETSNLDLTTKTYSNDVIPTTKASDKTSSPFNAARESKSTESESINKSTTVFSNSYKSPSDASNKFHFGINKTASPIFGTSTDPKISESSPISKGKSLFGSDKTLPTSQASALFQFGENKPLAPGFGASAISEKSDSGSSKVTPLFGNNTQLATAKATNAGSPSTAVQPFGSSQLATAATSNTFKFGAKDTSAPIFGATASTQMNDAGSTSKAAAPLFGSSSQASTAAAPTNFQFGAKDTSAPIFGATASTQMNDAGSTSKVVAPVFGSSSQASTAAAPSNFQFGAKNTSATIFGAAASTQMNDSGTTNKAAPLFGSSSQPATAAASNMFQFGAKPTSAPTFGASATTQMNDTEATSKTTSLFGNNSPLSIAKSPNTIQFGAKGTSAPTFGATTSVQMNDLGSSSKTNSLFGSNSQLAPAAASSLFQFGASKISTPSFGASNNTNTSESGSLDKGKSLFSGNNASATTTITTNMFQFGTSKMSAPVFGSAVQTSKGNDDNANKAAPLFFGDATKENASSPVVFGGGFQNSNAAPKPTLFGNTPKESVSNSGVGGVGVFNFKPAEGGNTNIFNAATNSTTKAENSFGFNGGVVNASNQSGNVFGFGSPTQITTASNNNLASASNTKSELVKPSFSFGTAAHSMVPTLGIAAQQSKSFSFGSSNAQTIGGNQNVAPPQPPQPLQQTAFSLGDKAAPFKFGSNLTVQPSGGATNMTQSSFSFGASNNNNNNNVNNAASGFGMQPVAAAAAPTNGNGGNIFALPTANTTASDRPIRRATRRLQR